jgi:hypothetical protein
MVALEADVSADEDEHFNLSSTDVFTQPGHPLTKSSASPAPLGTAAVYPHQQTLIGRNPGR